MKGWKEIFHANSSPKRARITILILNKIDFESILSLLRDKKKIHYIMIKWSINQENMKQILTELKGEIDNSTIIVGHFNAPLSTVDKTTR